MAPVLRRYMASLSSRYQVERQLGSIPRKYPLSTSSKTDSQIPSNSFVGADYFQKSNHETMNDDNDIAQVRIAHFHMLESSLKALESMA
jgi:hypothetical protein